MILKLLLIFIWLFIFPSVIGNLFKRKDEKYNLLYSWMIGNVLQMGIYFVLAIPLILLKKSFYLLTGLYGTIIVILLIISVVKILKNRAVTKKQNRKINFKEIIKKISIFQIIAILVIVAQLGYKLKYANVNNDDAIYVANSTDMIRTGKMYLSSFSTGEEKDSFSARKALAPISAYYASISVFTNVHVTIITHTVMSIIFLMMAYILYYYIGKKIFKEKDSIYIFLIILSFLNFFTFSVKGASRYMILYTWFGRSILGGILLPLTWLVCLEAMNKESGKLLDWIKLFIVVLASCLTTEMAVPLSAISIGAFSVICSIKDRKISYILKSIICIIPCIIIGVLYLLLK